jgi:uncharacterized cupredoxin-like copper-binding protein
MARFRIGLVVGVAAAVLTWALPASAQQSARRVTTVTVTAGKPTEFAFKLSQKKVPRGIVIFKVTNAGTIPHDFKISGRKTRLLQPGKSDTLRVVLTKGPKQYICTVTGHAAAGMKGTLVVT